MGYHIKKSSGRSYIYKPDSMIQLPRKGDLANRICGFFFEKQGPGDMGLKGRQYKLFDLWDAKNLDCPTRGSPFIQQGERDIDETS